MVKAVPASSPRWSGAPAVRGFPLVAVGEGVCAPHSRGLEPVMLLLKKRPRSQSRGGGRDSSAGAPFPVCPGGGRSFVPVLYSTSYVFSL